MDPALWELLRAEPGADGDRVLEAIIRLARPGIEIPDIRIVSRFGAVATCRIRARDIVPVRARRDVVSLKAARGLNPGFEPATGAAVPDALPWADFRPTDVRRSPGLTLTGKGVVVASADWGVDVDSAAFRWPAGSATAGDDRPADGTRFLSFWDQRDLAAGPRPDPYGYGTAHDREQIDRALHDPRPYEQLGYHPAIADRGGHGAHGTHVLDIAAGNGQAGGPAGMAPDADLVFVHLADRATGGLANLGDSVRLLEAVDFISRTAGSRPCVINISAGRTSGPKDGTTLVERALDELLAATPGRFVVNSAGNYFGWRTHSCGRVAPGESRSLTFVIDPADITLNELEIWYDGADEFAVRIDPPGYAAGPAVRLGERSDLLIEGQAVGRVYHRKHDPNNGDNHIVAYIDPVGRAGNWTVTLEARQVNSGRFHAWIERDDTCRGCQARFTPADSNPVTTIGTIATSRLPLVVGAYDGHDPARPVAPFSSSGPSRDLRPKPDLVAPGVEVLAARSASIIDSHNPGLLVRKSGTSMATPHVTGAVALCLEAAGNTLSARQIRALVLGSCDPVRDPNAPYRLGRGYLNIPRLIADLQRALTAPSAKEPTMNTDDSIVLLAAAPANAYREYLYRPHSQLARWIDERFDVVARPGQRIDQAPQLGDVLLEVTLGRVKPGRCLLLKAHDLELEVSPRRLPAGQLLLRPRKPAEMSEPQPVEPTAETEDSNPPTDVAAGAQTAAVPDFRQPEEAAIQINMSVTIDQAATKAVDMAKLLLRQKSLRGPDQDMVSPQENAGIDVAEDTLSEADSPSPSPGAPPMTATPMTASQHPSALPEIRFVFFVLSSVTKKNIGNFIKQQMTWLTQIWKPRDNDLKKYDVNLTWDGTFKTIADPKGEYRRVEFPITRAPTAALTLVKNNYTNPTFKAEVPVFICEAAWDELEEPGKPRDGWLNGYTMVTLLPWFTGERAILLFASVAGGTTLAHELTHWIGLRHKDFSDDPEDRSNIGHAGGGGLEVDREELRRLWRWATQLEYRKKLGTK